VLLNEQDFSKLTVKKAKAHSSVAAIDIALRTVNNPVFTELCSQEHPELRAVRNQERSALRLLKTHVRNRASHTRTGSSSKKERMTVHRTHLLMRAVKCANTQNRESKKCGRMLKDTFCTACKSTRTAHGIHYMKNMNKTG